MAKNEQLQQRERRLITEYVRTAFPNDRAFFNFRVGPLPAQAAGVDIGKLSPNIWKVYNRYVDALVIKPDKMIAIEAKLESVPGAVSQLELYKQLIPQTPELAAYAQLPIDLEIVCAFADPEFIKFANSKGITVQVFRPPWAVEYLYERNRI